MQEKTNYSKSRIILLSKLSDLSSRNFRLCSLYEMAINPSNDENRPSRRAVTVISLIKSLNLDITKCVCKVELLNCFETNYLH